MISKETLSPAPHLQKTIPASNVVDVAVDDDDVHKTVVMLPLSMHLLILPSLTCLVK